MFRRVCAAMLAAWLMGVGTASGASVAGSITYQGALDDGGAPANGVYDFWFRLWDAPSGGSVVGSLLTVSDVQVTNGVFTVALYFGSEAFSDQQRYLEMAVRPDGLGPHTLLTPRQPLTAGPVAHYALAGGEWRRSGDVIHNVNDDDPVLINRTNPITSSEYFGVDAPTTGYGGMYLNTQLGGKPFYGYSTGTYVRAWTYVDGINNSWKLNVDGTDRIMVRSDGLVGIGTTNPVRQLDVLSALSTGIHGETTQAAGTGVYGKASGQGVMGFSATGDGVHGTTTSGYGVYGNNGGSNSVGYAGYFNGRVNVGGNLHVAGTLSKLGGTFKIDHPLDPANKTLSHSFVESPDMMNLYNGNVTTDADGRATITMPAWFEALNRDFRYQLTTIGSFARAMVEREIDGNTFVIRTDAPNVRVSWQVSGVRQDVWAKDHPVAVEADKPASEKGTYLYPAGFAARSNDDTKAAPATTSAAAANAKGGR
jgi:hypothetical protein